jgi:hypothetical protein
MTPHGVVPWSTPRSAAVVSKAATPCVVPRSPAGEIAEDLRSALEQIESILTDLQARPVEAA